ncbi:MAG: hypothetical protein R6U28_01005, partial [Cyclonatronaceae bacterium]
MGQQQLLLVILVTILVGIATVVAINVFGTAADQANRDAVRQDLLGAAATAQALWERPAAMGGYGQGFDQDIDIRRLNIPRGSDLTAVYTEASIVNDNGEYSVEGSGTGTDSSIEITGEPRSGGDDIVVTLNRTEASGDQPEGWGIVWTEGGTTTTP